MAGVATDHNGADHPHPFVRIITINWNSGELTTRCVQSLLDTEYPKDRFEIVVVDNGSTDGSLDSIRTTFGGHRGSPVLRILENGLNLGFAEGCNRAMRDRDGISFVALVNNDTEVEVDWLGHLVKGLNDNPDAGAASACLVLAPSFVEFNLEVSRGAVSVMAVEVDGVDSIRRCVYAGGQEIGDPTWPLDTVHVSTGIDVIQVPARQRAQTVRITLRSVDCSGPNVLWRNLARGRAGAEVSLLYEGERVEPEVNGELNVMTFEVELTEHRRELLNGLGTGMNPDCEGFDIGFGQPVESVADLEPALGFCGGGVLLRSTAIDQVGLFDPRFFAYYEDSDLSWRMRRAGWKIIAVPQARIHHAFGAAGGSRAPWFFFLNYRNWMLTVISNGDFDEIRHVLCVARQRAWNGLRGSVLSPLKHRERPSWRLTRAWILVFLGVLAATPRRLVVRWFPQRSASIIGRKATASVRSRFAKLPD